MRSAPGLLALTVVLATAGCRRGVADPGPGLSGGSEEGPAATVTGGAATGSDSGAVPGTTSTTGDSGDGSDPKLDLVWDDIPEPINFTCDNIDRFPKTSLGCEFYGVDAPLFEESGWENDLPYGISVGNPSSEVATIAIHDRRAAGGALRLLDTFTLMPAQSRLVEVNGTGGILDGIDHQVAPAGFHEHAAFRVTSDVPITAMQINPVGGAASFVPEASLLLPVNALDTAHYALGYEHFQWQFGGQGWVVVVAVEDGTTVSTVDGDVTLDAFDAYHFAPGADATGYFVGADAPIAVFSGVGCTEVPDGWAACDHLEEQVMPLAAWGTTYVAARHPMRETPSNATEEPVYWRFVAAVDDTDIEVTPTHVFGAGTIHIDNAGDFFQITTRDPFVAQSDKPFMLVQYMSGCNTVGVCIQDPDEVSGDPYMIQMVPVEQWLDTLPFLTDTSYPRDFAVISREVGTTVDLACLGPVPDDRFRPIPGTNYEYAHVDLDNVGGGDGACVDGQQFLEASDPVGVYVAGISVAASYGYPGGMHIEGLWDPPQDPEG